VPGTLSPIRADDAIAVAASETVTHRDVHEIWNSLLSEYVEAGYIGDTKMTAIDYEAVAADPRWDKLLSLLEKTQVPEGREERLAFRINVYNILAVKMILTEYPVETINELGIGETEVWDRKIGVVAGEEYSLNEVEHGIIRKMDEPLIHGAIVCASVSCPDLRPEAFTAEDLSIQMKEQMKKWMANPKKGARFDEENNRLYLTPIFDWFAEDFTGGGQTIIDFARPYLPTEIGQKIGEETTVVYLDYDWTLSDTKRLSKDS